MHRLLLCFFFLHYLAIGAIAQQGASPINYEQLIGTWKQTRFTSFGSLLPMAVEPFEFSDTIVQFMPDSSLIVNNSIDLGRLAIADSSSEYSGCIRVKGAWLKLIGATKTKLEFAYESEQGLWVRNYAFKRYSGITIKYRAPNKGKK